jgi:ribonuclease P protein component
VQTLARRVSTPHFVFLVAARDGGAGQPPRLGFIVTRKVGVAVVRNRIRRVCRECFRTWPGLLPDGVDLVVVARPGAEELGLEATRVEWTKVSGLLRKRAAEALRAPRTLDPGPPVPHVSGGRRSDP